MVTPGAGRFNQKTTCGRKSQLTDLTIGVVYKNSNLLIFKIDDILDSLEDLCFIKVFETEQTRVVIPLILLNENCSENLVSKSS